MSGVGDDGARPRLLIAGASGFLGRNLLDLLMPRDDLELVAAVRDPASLSGTLPASAIVSLDLADAAGIRETLATTRPTHVVNCAAYGVHPADRDAARAHAVNVDGALALLEAADAIGATRFVQIGSCSEYGPAASAIPETAPLDPRGVYAASKADASRLLIDRADRLETDLVVVRLFGLWGPHEPPHRLLPGMLAHLERGERIPLSPGHQIRDLSYAPQAAETLAAITLDPRPWDGAIVNLGTGTGVTIREFAAMVASALGAADRLDFGAVPMRPDEVASQIADIGRLIARGLPVPSADHERLLGFYLASRERHDRAAGHMRKTT